MREPPGYNHSSKLTMPDCEHRSTVTALGMDPLNAQIRPMFF